MPTHVATTDFGPLAPVAGVAAGVALTPGWIDLVGNNFAILSGSYVVCSVNGASLTAILYYNGRSIADPIVRVRDSFYSGEYWLRIRLNPATGACYVARWTSTAVFIYTQASLGGALTQIATQAYSAIPNTDVFHWYEFKAAGTTLTASYYLGDVKTTALGVCTVTDATIAGSDVSGSVVALGGTGANQGGRVLQVLADASVTTNVTTLPNDSALRWSAGAAEVSSSRGTVNSEANGFDTLFFGKSLAIKHDMTKTAGVAPKLVVEVDGIAATYDAATTVNVTHVTLADRLHSLRVRVRSLDLYAASGDKIGTVGTPPNVAAHLTGVYLDPGAYCTQPVASGRPKVLVMGDSNTSGYLAVEGGNVVEQTDATLSYAKRLEVELGADVTVVATLGQGYTVAGQSVGTFAATYAKVTADTPRDFSAFDLVILAHGTNDSAVADATLTAAARPIAQAIIAGGAKRVALLSPLGGVKASAIQAAATTAADPRITYIDTAGWMNFVDSQDYGHPLAYAHAYLARRLGDAIRANRLIGGVARRATLGGGF